MFTHTHTHMYTHVHIYTHVHTSTYMTPAVNATAKHVTTITANSNARNSAVADELRDTFVQMQWRG